MVDTQLSYEVERLRLQGVRRLPAERELAAQLGISRGALRRQLSKLVDDGQIVQRVGRNGGTYIRETGVDSYVEGGNAPFLVSRSLNSIVGVPTFLNDQGYIPSTKILRAEEREALSMERDCLRLGANDRVLVIRRLRSANGTPLSLEEMTLSATRFPDLLKRELTSIYELMEEEYDSPVVTAEETIGFGQATPAAAYLLQIEPRAALFDIKRIAYDSNEQPMEMSRDLFRSDITRLTVTSK